MSLLSRCTPRYTLFPYTTLFRSASGTNSIGDAYKAVQRGDVDYIITGGTESPLTNMAFAGFSSMKALSQNDDPKTASRPFDKNRDGFVKIGRASCRERV